ACLERNWDADGDGVFGEAYTTSGDSSDTTPEIQVGRVSARTPQDVAAYLEKYFRYARDPDRGGYLDRILLLGEVLFHVQWTLNGRSGEPDCYHEECNDTGGCRTDSDGYRICSDSDGADDCIELLDIVRDTLGLPHEVKLLLERHEWYGENRPDLLSLMAPESQASAMTHMSSGYSIVFHVGHGYHDRWAVGDGRILTADLSSLTNGTGQNRQFVAYGVNCHSAAVEYDSFGEKMVLMPDDGAVAYIGCTNADYPEPARPFSENFYRFFYGEPGATIGDAFFGTMASQALTGSQINVGGYRRFLLYTHILLGEPGMPVWQGTPDFLAIDLPDYAAGEVPLGTGTLRVSVDPSALELAWAQVCVHKEGEVYAVGRLGGGARDIDLPFHPRTTGDFSVTVTAPGFLPATMEATVTGPSAGRALHFVQMTPVDDGTGASRGNGNGTFEPGERMRLQLTLANAGTQSAAGVGARLRLAQDAPAGCAGIVDSVAELGTIGAGATGSDASAFLVELTSSPPAAAFGEADRIELPFVLVLDPGESETEVDLRYEFVRPRLGLSTNRLGEPAGGTYPLWIGLSNLGKGTASHLLARLISEDSGDIAVQGSGQLPLGDVAPGDTALAGPFPVQVTDASGILRFTVIDTFQTPDDTLHVRMLDLEAPTAPAAPVLTGQYEAVHVTWSDPPVPRGDGISGYIVYRADAPEGPYAEVMPGIVSGHRFILDAGLGSLQQYSYKVAAVDDGGNVGTPSASLSAYTSPGVVAGWPSYIEVPTKASPLICELDGWTSNGREIVFCGETVYAYHGGGSEVVDGDRIELTVGPFASPPEGYVGDEFWGKPAAADIDDDGEVEVVAIAFNRSNSTSNKGELYCWGPDGTVEWIYVLPKCIAWMVPTLEDLNGDGCMEVIWCAGPTDHAAIYVLDCHGAASAYGSSDGLLKDVLGTNLYQSPAVGDVDGDGEPEIVIATRKPSSSGALWVVNPDGTSPALFAGGIPFTNLGGSTQTTSSPTLCNVDGQPGDEMFIVTEQRLMCIDNRAIRLWTFPFSPPLMIGDYELLPEAALGDINGDEVVDLALVDAGGKLHVLNAATGAELSPFPVTLGTDARYGSCILANLDDDPHPEVIFGDNKGRIHAYRYDGSVARGFPIRHGGNLVRQSLAAWDVDLDGFQNLVVQAMDVQKIAIFDMAISPFPEGEEERIRENPWPMRFRDVRNTGRLTGLPPVAVDMLFEAPLLGEEGTVLLAWMSSADVTLFRVHRGPDTTGPFEVVGEVAGAAGSGTRRYLFRDRPPGPGEYVYRIDPVLANGAQETGPTRVVVVPASARLAFGIQRLWPDPMPQGQPLRIACALAGGEARVDAHLGIYDVQGRLVQTVFSGPQPTGVQLVEWDGRDGGGRPLSTGLYVVRLKAGERMDTRRVLLIR
ncbi:MAG: C25 family cysteine peptidase, partial [Candidatus Eisenbacteria bacterium]